MYLLNLWVGGSAVDYENWHHEHLKDSEHDHRAYLETDSQDWKAGGVQELLQALQYWSS